MIKRFLGNGKLNSRVPNKYFDVKIKNVTSYVINKTSTFQAAGWLASTYICQQFIRLGSNIILAWLLAPSLLGTMVLINTLRTGIELLTDVGIGQSIVQSPRGNDPKFYNTAWTIQIIRGIFLCILTLALTIPLSLVYDNNSLREILPILAPVFIFSGVSSHSRFLLQKRLELRKLTLFELAFTLLSTLIQIGLALYTPTIWALVWGLFINSAITMVGTFFLINWRDHKLQWDKAAVREILNFGKWIFAGSIVYFLAMNFDRLYFANIIPMAMLGIYGVARTYSEAMMQLFQRLGNYLIFPKIAGSVERGEDLRTAIGSMRIISLLFIAAGLAMGIALADQFIYFLYDERYHAAGFFLPVLLFGTWFAIMATMTDAIIMGIGKPAGVMFSNATKLAILVIILPAVLSLYGINAALAVFVIAEFGRYIVLFFWQRNAGMNFAKQDLLATMVFVCLIFVFREITMLVGLTGGVMDWVRQASVMHS